MFVLDVMLVAIVVSIGFALGLAGIAYVGMILASFKG